MSENVFGFSCRDGAGRERSLEDYRGQVLLIVNTASKCGFTPQFAGLEALYEQFRDRGFCILGFPCNQFGGQDPGSNEQIQEFCQLNYGVSFPMFGKIDVNGSGADPLFRHLKNAAPGMLGDRIKWNFTKFLVNRQGEVVKRYAPTTRPEAIAADIEALLVQSAA
jgi:glutathione peroxidase